jgi:hypothetical protein
VLQQTPIVFSGAFAATSRVYNCKVIDSRAAVAVLGSDDIAYRLEPTIDANGLQIYNISFEYTSSSSFNPFETHVVAVVASAIGVPVVSHCLVRNAHGYTIMSNCNLR